jgi:hypothetical protein
MLLDNILLATILLGIALSVFAVINECLTWRSDQVAHLEAAVALRALYQRTFRRKKSLAVVPQPISKP